MPLKLPTACRWKGCSRVTRDRSGYCSEHKILAKRLYYRKEAKKRGQTPEKKFYDSKEWRFLRRHFLSQNPFCVICGRVAEMVDHIQPIRLGGALLDESNCQSMCHHCHNIKRSKEALIYKRIQDTENNKE